MSQMIQSTDILQENTGIWRHWLLWLGWDWVMIGLRQWLSTVLETNHCLSPSGPIYRCEKLKVWRLELLVVVLVYLSFHMLAMPHEAKIEPCGSSPTALTGQDTNLSLREQLQSGHWFNIKMTSYQYRKSHCGDKTIWRPSYLHNGISYTGKMASLYWIGVLAATWTSSQTAARLDYFTHYTASRLFSTEKGQTGHLPTQLTCHWSGWLFKST